MSDKIVTVVANFEARPGKEAELRAALIGLVGPTRSENGCLNYDLHESTEQAGKFMFHENWTTKAALDAHLQSAHIKALVPRFEDLCVAFPEIKLWDRIA